MRLREGIPASWPKRWKNVPFRLSTALAHPLRGRRRRLSALLCGDESQPISVDLEIHSDELPCLRAQTGIIALELGKTEGLERITGKRSRSRPANHVSRISETGAELRRRPLEVSKLPQMG